MIQECGPMCVLKCKNLKVIWLNEKIRFLCFCLKLWECSRLPKIWGLQSSHAYDQRGISTLTATYISLTSTHSSSSTGIEEEFSNSIGTEVEA